MLSPAFRNHADDSPAETTISQQLPGACHHATFFTAAAFWVHGRAQEGPGSDFFPTAGGPKLHWVRSVTLLLCGGAGAGDRSLEKVTEASGDAETADSGLGSESS